MNSWNFTGFTWLAIYLLVYEFLELHGFLGWQSTPGLTPSLPEVGQDLSYHKSTAFHIAKITECILCTL